MLFVLQNDLAADLVYDKYGIGTRMISVMLIDFNKNDVSAGLYFSPFYREHRFNNNFISIQVFHGLGYIFKLVFIETVRVKCQ